VAIRHIPMPLHQVGELASLCNATDCPNTRTVHGRVIPARHHPTGAIIDTGTSEPRLHMSMLGIAPKAVSPLTTCSHNFNPRSNGPPDAQCGQ